jgi:hypothetical protein
MEYTHALVNPESGESQIVSTIVCGVGLHQVLDDLGEITQVELVMELLGSGHKLGRVSNLSEGNGGSINDLLGEALALSVKGA